MFWILTMAKRFLSTLFVDKSEQFLSIPNKMAKTNATEEEVNQELFPVTGGQTPPKKRAEEAQAIRWYWAQARARIDEQLEWLLRQRGR
jgi:hypothetical protein